MYEDIDFIKTLESIMTYSAIKRILVRSSDICQIHAQQMVFWPCLLSIRGWAKHDH